MDHACDQRLDRGVRRAESARRELVELEARRRAHEQRRREQTRNEAPRVGRQAVSARRAVRHVQDDHCDRRARLQERMHRNTGHNAQDALFNTCLLTHRHIRTRTLTDFEFIPRTRTFKGFTQFILIISILKKLK